MSYSYGLQAAFHGGNSGSNPVRTSNLFKDKQAFIENCCAYCAPIAWLAISPLLAFPMV
jgi:hypothetical protein